MTKVHQVDELIAELEQYPDDYQARVSDDGAEFPPDVRERGPETVVL